MCKVLLNEELNGVELYFEGKPAQEIINSMKEKSFRWNGKKLCWYAKQNNDTLELAKILSGEAVKEVTTVTTKKNNVIDLWALTQFDEAITNNSKLSKKDIAKEVRSYLKKRFPFVKFSIRVRGYNSIDCDIMASPFEKNSIYLNSIVEYCKKFVNTYNWDDSDIMTDYYHVNFYGGYFQLDYDYVQTEATQEIIEAMKNFDSEVIKAEELKKIEEEKKYQEYLAEQKENEKKYQLRLAEEKNQREYILNNVEVVDVEENYYVVDAQFANLNKNNTLAEYNEEIETGKFYYNTLKVEREIHFKDQKSLGYFSNMLLHDFDFITGTGGSYTEDLRINSMTDYYNMSQEEKNSVEWLLHGIAVYYNNEIQFVIDAQGYNYSRYVGVIAAETEIQKDFEYNQVVTPEEIEKIKLIANDVNMLVNDTIEGTTAEETRKNIVTVIKANNIKLNKSIVQQVQDEKNKEKLYNCLNKCDSIQDQLINADIIDGEKITIISPSMLAGASISQGRYNSTLQEKISNTKDTILIYKGFVNVPESVLYINTSNGQFNSKATKYGSYDSKAIEDILYYLDSQNIKPIINTYKPLF